ncbi:MAG: Re/Si-specific NAD(P)(+) transhydrogenase subunit alpha [Saprospiraceae bacterium]|nr:Re/Si-specific NAD(P)(+) transhydrogenase subunit alpha [Saprospiraceae bacterium]
MIVAVPKEIKKGENRVALTPDVVKLLIKSGFTVRIESNAGQNASFSDENYIAAGAEVVQNTSDVWSNADVLLKVNPPSVSEAKMVKQGSILISFMYAYTIPDVLAILNERKAATFSMDAVPRISRAQKMDALSSQTNLAGYKAVIAGANASGKILPLMMTAAGTISPAKVLIFGAGVAGLQAIATAKRLGAIVEVTDVRPETKEQVESLGGKFLTVDAAGGKMEGGYAREVSKEFLEKQQALIQQRIKEMDIVITTALVPGKKAPVLVSEDMVKSMKSGSVIVDMAVEWGGNCALSQKDTTVTAHNVIIIGESNLPSHLPVNASELYARNISTLLLHLATSEGFKWEMEEEITKGSLITHQGATVHTFTNEILAKMAK